MRPSNMLTIVMLLCALSAIPVQRIAAQDLVPLKRDAEAIALAEHVLAVEGSSLAAGVGTMLTGTLQNANGTPIPIRVFSFGTKMTRTEVDKPSGTNVRIVNNGNAVLSPAVGKPRRLNGLNALAERVPYIPTLSLLGDYLSPDIQIEYLGAKTVVGFQVIQIALSFAPTTDSATQKELLKRTRTIYSIDPATYRVVQMEYDICAENDSNAMRHYTLVYSSYSRQSGRDIPGTVSILSNGKPVSAIKILSYIEGSTAPNASFDLPAVTK